MSVRANATDSDAELARQLWLHKQLPHAGRSLLEVNGEVDNARCEPIARLVETTHGGTFSVESIPEEYGSRLILTDCVAWAQRNIDLAIRHGMDPNKAKEMFGI